MAASLLAVAAAAAGPAAAAKSGLKAALQATDDAPPSDPRAATKDFDSWDWRHVAQIVANLQATPPANKPLVILFGGSSARESTIDDAHWAAQITRRAAHTGRFETEVDAAVYNLGSKHRTFALDLQLVKKLRQDVPTIIYIGVNLGRFCVSPTSPTISLPAPLESPPSYNQHIYSITKRIQPKSLKRYYVRYWLTSRYPEFKRRYRANLDNLEKILRYCSDKPQLHPVMLDLPRDMPIIGHAFDAPIKKYHIGCKALAAEYGVPWVNFVAKAGFVNRDFFDIFHTVEPGRAKYQKRLSDDTIDRLEDYDMVPLPEPTPSESPTAAPTS